jgi:hypothetical protein
MSLMETIKLVSERVWVRPACRQAGSHSGLPTEGRVQNLSEMGGFLIFTLCITFMLFQVYIEIHLRWLDF